MSSLQDTLETITQRTGAVFDLLDGNSRTRFLSALRTDLASIIHQYNAVVLPLFDGLVATSGIDPLDYGINGLCIYTDATATSASADAFYDVGQARARTVKESFDVILSALAGLTTSLTVIADGTDVTAELQALETSVGENTLDIQQLRADTLGDHYVLDQTGTGEMTYSLSQHIDALGALFTNFPGTGNTYGTSYPGLAFTILLSEIVVDSTLPQSAITGLVANIASMRTFMGMDGVADVPTYSAHGAVTTVADGDSLEIAVQKLDAAVDAIVVAASPFGTTSHVTTNENGTYGTDDFVFGGPQLADDGNAAHDKRLFFDKSTGAVRGGTATGTQWDTVGAESAGFGRNCIALADQSFVTGLTNAIDATSQGASIVGGGSNTITDAVGAVILGGSANEADTGADYSVVSGNNGQALMMNSRVLGGGGASVGAAQTQEVVVLGSWAATDANVLLTLDGAAPSAANLMYIPTNASALVKVEYIIRGKQGGSAFFGGATMQNIVGRVAGAAAIGTPMEMEGTSYRGAALHTSDMFQSSTSNAPLSGTAPICTLVVSGVAGGFYVNVNFTGALFGGAADGIGRAVARVTITQVRYLIP